VRREERVIAGADVRNVVLGKEEEVDIGIGAGKVRGWRKRVNEVAVDV
jgi:hypothetical protein